MTRSELEALIARYLKRQDLSADIPGFISLATTRIGRKLRTPENTVIQTLNITSTPYSLPNTYREMGKVYREADRGPISLTSVGTHRLTRYSTIGVPAVYSVSAYELSFAPFTEGDFTLEYFEEPAALDSGSATNAVLDAYPYLYLYASLIEAQIFLEDPEMAQAMIGIYDGEIRELNKQARRGRTGEAPAQTGV